MLEKTLEQFEETFKTLDKEMKTIFKNLSNKKVRGGTRIRIKKSSTVRINGVLAKLENDCIVVSLDPNAMMTPAETKNAEEKRFCSKD